MTPREDLPFRLFAHVVPVRGARRSTLCDLQRGRVHLVPNGMHDLLTLHRDRTLAELRALCGPESGPVLEEYFAFLQDAELGFWCEAPEAFPEMDLTYEYPGRISHAIVDVDAASRHDFPGIVAQLDGLGCRALQVRAFDPLPIGAVEAILEATRGSRLRSVELLLAYAEPWPEEALVGLVFRHQRIGRVVVHGAPEDRLERTREGDATLHYVRQRIDPVAHCGVVDPGYFTVNVAAFTEARGHNSCLNRKISVDRAGWIRNCPSMPDTFGHASTTPLAAAADHPAFRAAWAITKDRVEVCRDCEFRYVCTDCRAHTRDPADPFAKPAKCGYDPYTATWSAPPAAPAAPARAPLPVVPRAPVPA